MNKTFITLFTLLFCLTSSVGWSLEYKDVVFRDGLYYKKFSHQPLTGKTIGRTIGSFKNGKKEGYWVGYDFPETFNKKFSGTYKNGVKVSD